MYRSPSTAVSSEKIPYTAHAGGWGFDVPDPGNSAGRLVSERDPRTTVIPRHRAVQTAFRGVECLYKLSAYGRSCTIAVPGDS